MSRFWTSPNQMCCKIQKCLPSFYKKTLYQNFITPAHFAFGALFGSGCVFWSEKVSMFKNVCPTSVHESEHTQTPRDITVHSTQEVWLRPEHVPFPSSHGRRPAGQAGIRGPSTYRTVRHSPCPGVRAWPDHSAWPADRSVLSAAQPSAATRNLPHKNTTDWRRCEGVSLLEGRAPPPQPSCVP